MQATTVIATLSPGHENLEDYSPLIRRNKAIAANLAPKLEAGSFDLVIFHSGDIPKKHQTVIEKESATQLKFIDISAQKDSGAFCQNNERPSMLAAERTLTTWSQHACHFWFIDFLNHLSQYSTLIHIDESAVLLDSPDLVELLRTQDLVLLTAEQQEIDPYSMVALPEFCLFFRSSRLEYKTELAHPLMGPRTNCMTLNLEYLRTHAPFLDFQKAVDASGMIYSHSWNISALWSAYGSLYEEQSRIANTCRNLSFFDPKSKIVINPVPKELEGLVNIALNKPAKVNVEYYPPYDGIESSAANAVSGIFEGKYTFHTEFAENPFWEVDLLDKQSVAAIQIYNRGDHQAQRAQGMLIQISDDGENFQTVHQQNEVFYGKTRAPLLLDFRKLGGEQSFRYLRLSLPKQECFHLDQIEVYAVQ